MTETIPIAADHAGFELKEKLKLELEKAGYRPLDLGTHSTESTDYPDYAHALAQRVESGELKRGILLCGTGLGMAAAANRHAHVRAAVAWTPEAAVYLANDRVFFGRLETRKGESGGPVVITANGGC